MPATPHSEPGDSKPDPFDLLHRSIRQTGSGHARELSGERFLEWSRKVHEPKGRLDFERFAFQPELYRALGDPNIHDVVIMKGTQVGVSGALNRLALFYAECGFTALYVFPTRQHMTDFADSRVEPILRMSPLAEIAAAGHVKNKGLKAFGAGHILYRGSQSKSDLIGSDADVLVLDEYDSLRELNIPEAEARISGSTLGLVRRVGVPSHPDVGIDWLYDHSDRRQWHVECEHCGEWQTLDFYRNVTWRIDEYKNIRDARVACSHCRRTLDVRRGEWVAEYPGRDRVGFHVHRLLVPDTNLNAMIEASQRRELHLVEAFHRNDLGVAYSSAEAGLDRATIAACQAAATEELEPYTLPAERCGTGVVTMGVDVASTRDLTVRISEHIDSIDEPSRRKRALFIGEVATFDEVAALIKHYDVALACIDHLPERRSADALVDAFPGRVFTVRYQPNARDAFRVDEWRSEVAVDRDIAMVAVVEQFRARRNLLPETLPAGYAEQLVRPRRLVSRDELGRKSVRWREPGNSDFFHAEVFDLVALEVLIHTIARGELADPEVIQIAEFNPSRVNDYDDMTYRPGPSEPAEIGWDTL